MENTTDLEILDRLEQDPAFLKLRDYVPPLSIIRALGKERDELTHSDLVALLFDPERNRTAHVALKHFLSDVRAALDSLETKEEEGHERLLRVLTTLDSEDRTSVRVHRELFFIDIVLEIKAGNEKLVLAIENKIDALERKRQIADYQDTLLTKYPSRDGIIVFLTPEGRPPGSATSSNVPCVSLGYDSVQSVIRRAQQTPALGARDWIALEELARHIKEEIMGEGEQRIRDRVRELWQNHRRAMRLLVEHQPRLRDVFPLFEGRVQEKLPGDWKIWTYPRTRREIDEIKVTPKSWLPDYPFTFVFHTKDEVGEQGGRPRLRLLIAKHKFSDREDELRDWATRANESLGEQGIEVDPDFPSIRGWPYWRRVLKEDDYPEGANLEEPVPVDETVDEVIRRIDQLYNVLDEHIPGDSH